MEGEKVDGIAEGPNGRAVGTGEGGVVSTSGDKKRTRAFPKSAISNFPSYMYSPEGLFSAADSAGRASPVYFG
jgi:hypothetical protein